MDIVNCFSNKMAGRSSVFGEWLLATKILLEQKKKKHMTDGHRT